MEKTDAVIENSKCAAEKAKGRVFYATKFLKETKEKVLDGEGGVRRSFALECAQRQIELEVLQTALKAREDELKHATEDLPRREEERIKAVKLEAEAVKLDEKAAALLTQLKAVEGSAASLRREAEDANKRASRTANALAACGA